MEEVRDLFHEGSTFSKVATYVVNGLGLVFLVFGSMEIQTFLSAEIIAGVLGVANIVKKILEKGPLSLLPPKA